MSVDLYREIFAWAYSSMEYINTSHDKVAAEIGSTKFTLEPGQTLKVPPAYGEQIMKLAPQIKPVDRRCFRCGLIIGHADATGELVEWVHVSPCGLVCTGRGHDHAGNPNNHPNPINCVKCKPHTCPMCEGTGKSTEKGHHNPCRRCNGRKLVPGMSL